MIDASQQIFERHDVGRSYLWNMSIAVDISCLPNQLENESFIFDKLQEKVKGPIKGYRMVKRSIDARKKPVVYRLRFEVSLDAHIEKPNYDPQYQDVSKAEPVHIIGFGPAGMFAALECLKLGLKPVVFERGKKVRDRRRDLAAINKEGVVHPDSNYCFGEGGAGTYSDGKLYTRSHKRGKIQDILEQLVLHGAKEDILLDAHPHIGTNALPKIIENMRDIILKYGGEIHFEHRVEGLHCDDDQLKAIAVANKNIEVSNVILATGHSARDIFEICFRDGISIERKPFAMGVRIEHPQTFINQQQYHQSQNDALPPASYSLVTQANGVGVYSFCMCPGGIVAPCATSDGEVVTNGWSPSKRNNPYANSGLVVEINDELLDLHGYHGVWGALELQKEIEQKAWELAGKTQKVPAQKVVDFINGKQSKEIPKNSYIPGTVSVNLHDLFPKFIASRLQQALKDFDRKMKGYIHPEAVLLAPESRTSSPIRIPRDKFTLEHVHVQGLYPCGEGAGYAGGIVSAAMDGQRCVRAIHARINAE